MDPGVRYCIDWLADLGLELSDGVTDDDLNEIEVGDRPIGAFLPDVLSLYAREIEREPWGRPVCGRAYGFDTECIDDENGYVRIVEGLVRAADASDRVTDLRASVDIDANTARVEATLDGVPRVYEPVVDRDWADVPSVDAIASDLARDGKRFYRLDEDQHAHYFFLSERAAEAINEKTGGTLVWARPDTRTPVERKRAAGESLKPEGPARRLRTWAEGLCGELGLGPLPPDGVIEPIDARIHPRFYEEITRAIDELVDRVRELPDFDRWEANFSPDSLRALEEWLRRAVPAPGHDPEASDPRQTLGRLFRGGDLRPAEGRLAFQLGAYLGETLCEHIDEARWARKGHVEREAWIEGPLVALSREHGWTANPFQYARATVLTLRTGMQRHGSTAEFVETWIEQAKKTAP